MCRAPPGAGNSGAKNRGRGYGNVRCVIGTSRRKFSLSYLAIIALRSARGLAI